MRRALFVGRFQPFHLGHLQAIQDILKENDQIIIIIGSARQHDTPENPFSVDERIRMVKDSLLAAGIQDFEISSVEDLHDNKLWTTAIKKAYSFDAVYSQNPWTIECFTESGDKVRMHRMFNSRQFSGRHIRDLISRGRDWHSLVPRPVHDYVNEIGGPARIKRLYREKKKRL